MRQEEGEAGVSGMGWCLRAAGERLLPSPHPTCAWCLRRALDSALRREKAAAPQSNRAASISALSSSPSSSPPWPTWGGGCCLGSRDPAACHARKDTLVLSQRSAQGPHPDPGSSQACSEALRTQFWAGGVREGITVTFSSTLSKEVPPCCSLLWHPVHFLLRVHHNV